MMDMSLQVIELSIVVAAANNNPTILNPDFLKYNDIVPFEWEVSEAEPPVCSPIAAQVAFAPGVKIVTEFDKVSFMQLLRPDAGNAAELPAIAMRYLTALPHVEYRAVGINPRGIVPVTSEEVASQFILDRLVADGPWRKFRGAKIVPSCRFAYQLDKGTRFTATIDSGRRTAESGDAQAAIIFSGNFHREIVGLRTIERLTAAKSMIERWAQDLATFKEWVSELTSAVEVGQ